MEEEEKLGKVMLERARTVKLTTGWRGDMFMVDQTVKVHMEQTLGNLLVGHAWREKRKTSSWPDEHA